MEKRTFGKTDLTVSPIAFGGNVFGWTLDEQQSFKILDAFIDAGFNFIDTADVYSAWVPGNKGGESETIIGNWIKKRGRRDDLVIATKLGVDMSDGNGKKNLSAAYMKDAVEASLKRLQTDHIDLYFSHYDDENTTVQETMEAFNQLITEGKVRYIAASNLSADRIAESNRFAAENKLAGYVGIQPLFNLYDRETFEQEYLPLVEKEELAVANYYALASGFLTGKYRSEADLNKSPRGGGIKKYLNDRGFAILKALDEVSAQYDTKPASVALAWLIAHPFVTAPIASATTLDQLDALVKAVQLELSDEAIYLLNKASAD